MLFTTPLPPLPAVARRTLPADVSRRPAPADWPFAPLTDSQRAAQAELEFAYRNNELRRLPTCFGDLA
ncbi:MAG: hypothetical protein ABI433_09950 [Burkholderiaceae bacterium]